MPRLRIAALLALASGVLLAADEPKKPTPKFKLGKDTTYVTGPLDADGYVDYEAALNERLKGKATPETNAVVLLLKAFGPKPEGAELKADFYKAIGIDPPPEKGEYLVAGTKFFADDWRGPDVQAFNDLETRLRQRPWKPEDSPKHAEYLRANEKPLAVAVEASRRTDYYHPMISRKPDGERGLLIGALLPTVQKTREVASLLSFRVTLKLGAGKADDALADALAMHRLSRLLSRGGSLIELLVAIAIQAIAHNSEVAVFEHGKLTAKQALAYQADLRNLPSMSTVAEKLDRNERFMLLDAIQAGRRHGFDALERLGDGRAGPKKTPEEIEQAAEQFDLEVMFRIVNSWYDRLAEATRKPTHAERTQAAKLIESELRKMKADMAALGPLDKFFLAAEEPEKRKTKVSERTGKIYVSLMLPAFQKVSEAADRGEQNHRNGLIAAGLAAHFADTKTYPDKLTDLVPKYLAKVPTDMFIDKELVYKKTDAGYLLYSVGPNGKDDGGKLLSDEPRGDDIGVRMPRR